MTAAPCFVHCGLPACVKLGCVRVYNDRHRYDDELGAPYDPCGCAQLCGGDGDSEGPGTCKGLPRPPEPPLVEIVLVPRDDQGAA